MVALHLEHLRAAACQHSLCAGVCGGGVTCKASWTQNQPTTHLVLAQISFLFRLPVHFVFTRYGRREQELGWRDRKGLLSLGSSASL